MSPTTPRTAPAAHDDARRGDPHRADPRRRRRRPWCLVRLTAAAVGALLPAAAIAHADVPANDDYLASTPVLTEHYHATLDTREAGEQQDLFVPAPGGGPPGGPSQPEPLSCNGQAYGKTVWFDFLPPTAGGARIVATGYDAVVAVYEYDPASGRIVRPVACQDASEGPSEQLDIVPPKLEKERHYTVQVGAAVTGGAAQSGTLDFTLDFYGDRDGDGVLDATDPCPDVAGGRGGCPAQIPGTPRLAIQGLRVVSLEWAGLQRGTEVRAECRGCGRHGIRQAVRAGGDGVARLTAFAGASAQRGAVLNVSARSRATGSGDQRYGAIGKAASYRLGSGGLAWKTRCLVPGSWKEQMACPR